MTPVCTRLAGAIYASGDSSLVLTSCSLFNNRAFSKGKLVIQRIRGTYMATQKPTRLQDLHGLAGGE